MGFPSCQPQFFYMRMLHRESVQIDISPLTAEKAGDNLLASDDHAMSSCGHTLVAERARNTNKTTTVSSLTSGRCGKPEK